MGVLKLGVERKWVYEIHPKSEHQNKRAKIDLVVLNALDQFEG